MIDDYMDDYSGFGLPTDGFLDLRTFHPSEIKELIGDYFAACRDMGLFFLDGFEAAGVKV